MKWELVVTDVKAGKTGRVRIEAPDQATAERIAGDKGWTVESVRQFEAPGIYPPGHGGSGRAPVAFAQPQAVAAPVVSTAEPYEEESAEDDAAQAAAERDEESSPPYDEEHPSASADAAEDDRAEQDDEPAAAGLAAVPRPAEEPVSVKTAGRPVAIRPPAQVRSPAIIPPAASTVPTAARPAARGGASGFFSGLLAVIFWLAGLGLIGWGALHLAYFVGYQPSTAFQEDTSGAVAANRLIEIKMLMRGLVGGVMVGAGLLAMILGTLVGRRNPRV